MPLATSRFAHHASLFRRTSPLLVILGACGGGTTTTPAEPRAPAAQPAESEAAIDESACRALLRPSLAKVIKSPDDLDSERPPTIEEEGVVLTPRGAGDHVVCVAAHSTTTCSLEPEDRSECDEDSVTHHAYAVGLISSTDRAVKDVRLFKGYEETTSRELLSWKMVATGPARDGVRLNLYSGSGDSDTNKVMWLDAHNGAFADLLTYEYGYEDAGINAEAKERVTERVVHGYFAIELDIVIKPFDDGDDDGEEKAVKKGTDTCTFEPAYTRYACKPGLVEDLVNRMDSP